MKTKKITILIVIFSFLFFLSFLLNKDFSFKYEQEREVNINKRDNYRDFQTETIKISESNITYEWYRTWGEGNAWCMKDPDHYMQLVALDSMDNIYILGTTINNAYDICLLKFSSNGDLLWDTTWGGIEHEEPKEILIDDYDNIYITGHTQSFGGLGGNDVFLLKYNSSGSLQWIQIWEGYDNEAVSGIIHDSLNNIYICGTAGRYEEDPYDFFLLKYNMIGELLWSHTWGISEEDWCYDISIDYLDNIYLVGGNSLGDMCLIKYSSSGSEQWYQIWGEEDTTIGKIVSTDSLGNIYVTGKISSPIYSYNFIIKFDTLGVELWSNTWQETYWDDPFQLVIDQQDNIYITGIAVSSSFYLVKFTSTGELEWDLNTGYGAVDLSCIEIDSLENIHLVGNILGNGQDIYYASINSNGVEIFNDTWGGSDDDICGDITLDSMNNIYIAGTTNNFEAGYNEIFLLKISNFLDNSAPIITPITPFEGQTLQDGVIFRIQAEDLSEVDWVKISIRQPGGENGIIIDPAYEMMETVYIIDDDQWQLDFDTTLLPDGYYILVIEASDIFGFVTTQIVSFSIRNWAVLERMPEYNKAGRIIPVKFSLRVTEVVDPSIPFVWNEELNIIIFNTKNPNIILQNSTFGNSCTDYRIDAQRELYITYFKTDKTPATYKVEIWRYGMFIGSFTFDTVKKPHT